MFLSKLRNAWGTGWLSATAVLMSLVVSVGCQKQPVKPTVTISKATTYLTQPLAPDGMPDYAGVVYERIQEGVTQDNNAARWYAQALWPMGLRSNKRAMVAKQLGVPIPDGFTPLRDATAREHRAKVVQWLLLQLAEDDEREGDEGSFAEVLSKWGFQSGAGGDPKQLDEQAYDLALATCTIPWTAAELPPLAEWLDTHQAAFALLEEATTKTHYFMPRPRMAQHPRRMWWWVSEFTYTKLRDAMRMLQRRSMWHLGESRLEASWRDQLAALRVGAHAGATPGAGAQLFSVALETIVWREMRSWIQLADPDLALTQQILRDLMQHPAAPFPVEVIDQHERFVALGILSRAAVREQGWKDLCHMVEMAASMDGVDLPKVTPEGIDWDQLLQDANGWFDRAAEIFRITNLSEQRAKRAALGEEVIVWCKCKNKGTMLARGVVAMIVDAVSGAFEGTHNLAAHRELTILVVGIHLHREKHGAYPEKLSQLVPDILPAISADPLSDAAPIYNRTSSGYVLKYAQNDSRRESLTVTQPR